MMKRICFVLNNFDVGGLEKVVINLVNNLDRKQFDIYVICLVGEGKLFDQVNLEREKFLILDKHGGIDLSSILAVRRFLVKNQIELVHAHNIAPLVYAGLARKMMFLHRPRVIYSEHNQIYRQIKAGKLKTKFFLSLADQVLTVSNKLKEFYRTELAMEQNVSTLYNGIPSVSDAPSALSKRDLGVKDDDFVVGTAVVLSEQKGIRYLLDAALKIKESGCGIHVVIAGDGPLREELEAYARENNLEQIVTFLGYRSDVHDLIKVYDVYILSSLWEGLPLALLEAMSAGKPIIATDVGGNAEIVENDVNGVIVESKDSAKLFEAIMMLYRDRDNLDRFAERNRSKFNSTFSLEKMVSDHANVYLR